MTKRPSQLGFIDKLFIGLLLTVFAGVVIHAPLTVWLGTIWPAHDILFKAWKEILMLIAVVPLGVILHRRKQWSLLKSPWVLVPAGYAILHVLLIPLFFSNPSAVIAGLMIDLRYVAFFVLVFLMIQLYPTLRRPFLWTFVGGAVLVSVFALLQVFVLPVDFLKVLGYSKETISPYLTVDENPDYVRINGTFRGPNPLGAYAVIGLTLLGAYWLRVKRAAKKSTVMLSVVIGLGLAVALWTSYSRSALVAGVAALGIVFLLTVGRRFTKWVWIGLFVAMFAVAGGVYAARDTSFVSNVILHENEETGSAVSSNDGHAESLVDGTDRMVRQPLGAGIGSTGSASLFTDKPVIIENQYLFIAHEAGWLGLALFMYLFVRVLWTSWRARENWLSLAVLASGIGMAMIGLLLPVWVDDSVSIIWWGLASLAIGGVYGRTLNATTKRTA